MVRISTVVKEFEWYDEGQSLFVPLVVQRAIGILRRLIGGE
jgi:hypothetical protein